MKSAYCIAITACLTVIWLYEEKKKRGMAGNLCWKAAVGYLITRFVFFAISNQEEGDHNKYQKLYCYRCA